MALKDTCNTLQYLLDTLQEDLIKAINGNKAAAQRMRTGSIKFEKIAKLYRKESVKAEKTGALKRKPQAKKTTAAKKLHSSKKEVKCVKKPVSKKTASKPKKAQRHSEKRKSAKR